MNSLRTTLLLLAALAAGCHDHESAEASLPASDLPERFHLADAPAGAVAVAAARKSAAQGEHLVVRGIVGGSTTPFVENLAAFTIVDPGLVNVCASGDDHCPTPWDYCCVDPAALRDGSLMVEFRDGSAPLPAGARGFHGLDHLSEVVVAGRAEVDERGNLTVVATGLHLP
jgi:hypothetical protein